MSQQPGGERRGEAVPDLLLGPGDRLAQLGPVLRGLAARLTDLGDVSELARRSADEDVELVIDADLLALEDLGYVRRFLARDGRTRATAVGEDPGTRVARALLALPRARWMSWPPVLDDLLALGGADPVAAPARPALGRTRREMPTAHPREHRASAGTGTGSPAWPASEPRHEPADEIDQIQAILEGQTLLDDRETRAKTPGAPRAKTDFVSGPQDDVSIPQDDVSTPADFMSDPPSFAHALEYEIGRDLAPEFVPRLPAPVERVIEDPRTSDAPPPWWRAQVADLADAAQRVELGVQALRLAEPDDAEEVREHVDLLDAEVARLVQFARTLGYVAAPPARGDQVFDLSDTVQMFVAQLASRPDRSPRCQFRSTEPIYVRSDRALLGQAFDAYFWLAGACTGSGDLVRAQVLRAGGAAEVRLEFPAGPLAGVEIARILEPYGLRRILPDLGPNALSAASSILVGQGGRVDLTRLVSGRLQWTIALPAVDAPPSKKPPEPKSVARNPSPEKPR